MGRRLESGGCPYRGRYSLYCRIQIIAPRESFVSRRHVHSTRTVGQAVEIDNARYIHGVRCGGGPDDGRGQRKRQSAFENGLNHQSVDTN